MKKYNFISGLPRSGSTLLTAILNQNPRFFSEITDPLHGIITNCISSFDNYAGIGTLMTEEHRKQFLQSVFEGFYKIRQEEIVFNTARAWQGDLSLLKDLFQNFKMIVCVREIEWIIDSFEKLHRQNNYKRSTIFLNQALPDVYARAASLMGLGESGAAFVHQPWTLLKQVIFSEEDILKHCLFVEYEALAKDPENTMKKIYLFLNEEYYSHDFDNVETSNDEFDQQVGLKGLHTTRKKVEYVERETILPIDLVEDLKQKNFWKNPKFNANERLKWIKYEAPTLQYFGENG